MTSSFLSNASSRAGAATVDITPSGSVFLFGYPHVSRYSTGVHDPIECSALYLESGRGRALFLASDIIFLDRDYALSVRQRIAAATGIAVDAIMLTVTHAHSGPVMTNNLSNSADSVVPKADPKYLEFVADRMLHVAKAAVESAIPAEMSLVRGKAEGVGSNRHDPSGPADPEVPLVIARSPTSKRVIGCLLVYGMHPTVMHEDSTLISSDFVHYTRNWLRGHALRSDCPVLYIQGASGNQSPRHMTKANTFEEAQRIGENLGRSLAPAIAEATFAPLTEIRARRSLLDVEPREFPAVDEAKTAVTETRARFERLRSAGAPRQDVRTAECDVFGAEKTAVLAQAAADGRLAAAVAKASPAEIQAISIGRWNFVAWPGEFFVEHGLAVKAKSPDTFVITLANGELQGYIATPDAVARGAYEATNAVFKIENGPRFVARTLELLQELRRD